MDKGGFTVILFTMVCLFLGLFLLSFSLNKAKYDDGQSDAIKNTKRSKKYDNGDVYEGEIWNSDLLQRSFSFLASSFDQCLIYIQANG